VLQLSRSNALTVGIVRRKLKADRSTGPLLAAGAGAARREALICLPQWSAGSLTALVKLQMAVNAALTATAGLSRRRTAQEGNRRPTSHRRCMLLIKAAINKQNSPLLIDNLERPTELASFFVKAMGLTVQAEGLFGLKGQRRRVQHGYTKRGRS
jgi:hypothetical protein